MRDLILFIALLSASAAHAAIESPRFEALLAASKGLAAQVKGPTAEFLLIQFWSPYCEPCGAEVPEINAVLERANREQPRLAALGVPTERRKGEVRAFVRHFGPRFPQWDPDADFFASVLKNEIGLPWCILLDRDRKVVKEWVGKITAPEIETALARHGSARTEKERAK